MGSGPWSSRLKGCFTMSSESRVAVSGGAAWTEAARVDAMAFVLAANAVLPHGGDGGSSGLVYAPVIRSGNTASGTPGGEYTGDSARRSRTRGRRAHGGLDSPRSRSASDRDLRYSREPVPPVGQRAGR